MLRGKEAAQRVTHRYSNVSPANAPSGNVVNTLPRRYLHANHIICTHSIFECQVSSTHVCGMRRHRVSRSQTHHPAGTAYRELSVAKLEIASPKIVAIGLKLKSLRLPTACPSRNAVKHVKPEMGAGQNRERSRAHYSHRRKAAERATRNCGYVVVADISIRNPQTKLTIARNTVKRTRNGQQNHAHSCSQLGHRRQASEHSS